MRTTALLATFLSPMLTGCLLGPTDDGAVTSTTAALPFNGYDLEPNGSVQVRAFDFTAEAFANIGAPVRAATAATSWGGDSLYAWSASRTLAPRFWHTKETGGSCANVGAQTTHANGSTYNLMTVEADWGACASENQTVGDFSRECRSNHNSFASIYTVDWDAVPVTQSMLDTAGLFASATVSINFDNYQPEAYRFCNSGNPDGCPAGLSGDPETYKFFNPNASFMRSGGDTETFSITPARARPMTVYIDDLRSNRIDFRVSGGRFIMGISFEASGPEIRMNCIRDAACPFVDGRTIDFTAPRAELSFALEAEGDRVRFTDISTTFTTGLTGNEEADQAAAAIATAITEMMTSDARIRASVATALTEIVRGAAGLSAYPVRGLTVSGSRLSVLPGCPLPD